MFASLAYWMDVVDRLTVLFAFILAVCLVLGIDWFVIAVVLYAQYGTAFAGTIRSLG